MTIAFVSAGTLTATAGGSTSATPAMPATITAGNLLIGFLETLGGGINHTWPAGWTEIREDTVGSGRISIAWKLAVGSDSAPTITWTTNSYADSQVFQYTAADASPIGATQFTTGSGTPHTSASMNTTVDGSTVLFIDVCVGSSTQTTNPSGWTSRASAADGTPTAALLTDKVVATAGATGAISTAGGTTTWMNYQVELLMSVLPDAESTTSATSTAEATMVSYLSTASSAGVAGAATSVTNFHVDAPGAVVIAAAPVVQAFTYEAATSVAAFVTTAASPTIFWEVVTTGITFDGAILGTRLVDAAVTGVVTVNGAVVGSASYHVSAASEAQIQDGVQFVQDFWDGWAFNLNTGAPSMYEDFKFNSFARIGSNYYGCSDTGIYLLGGELDVAAEIDATVTTGYSDLSTDKFDGGQVKHVTTAYLDARTVSPMTITCRTEGQEYTYTFDTDRTNMASARAEIGKGLKGTLWQFELKNVAGADFEVESLTVLVDPTKRKA